MFQLKKLRIKENKIFKNLSIMMISRFLDENIEVGIITPDKDIVPDAETLSPAYLVFDNYEIILKWNRSLRFALAVCTLKRKKLKMKYRFIKVILLSLLLLGCEQSISNKKIKVNESLDNRYKNVGFALIYNEELSNIKKLEPRSLDIYHKFLKKKSIVKITNLKNGNFFNCTG